MEYHKHSNYTQSINAHSPIVVALVIDNEVVLVQPTLHAADILTLFNHIIHILKCLVQGRISVTLCMYACMYVCMYV